MSILWIPFPWAWIMLFAGVFVLFFNTGPTNTILANVTHPAIRSTAFALNIFIIHAFGDAISPVVLGKIADSCRLEHGDSARFDAHLGQRRSLDLRRRYLQTRHRERTTHAAGSCPFAACSVAGSLRRKRQSTIDINSHHTRRPHSWPRRSNSRPN